MHKHHEHGMVSLVTLLLVLVFAFLAGGPATSGTTDTQRQARNTRRQSDALRLLAVSAEFEANNNDQEPTSFQNGELRGAAGTQPVKVELGFYSTVKVKTGQQAPLQTDELWLVPGSTCSSPTGGTVVGIAPGTAVLYVFETASGFQGQCKDD